MSLVEYLCDACGCFFDVDLDTNGTEEPAECPVCHSHDTQVMPTLSSVYGYSSSATSGCDGDESGFR